MPDDEKQTESTAQSPDQVVDQPTAQTTEPSPPKAASNKRGSKKAQSTDAPPDPVQVQPAPEDSEPQPASGQPSPQPVELHVTRFTDDGLGQLNYNPTVQRVARKTQMPDGTIRVDY